MSVLGFQTPCYIPKSRISTELKDFDDSIPFDDLHVSLYNFLLQLTLVICNQNFLLLTFKYVLLQSTETGKNNKENMAHRPDSIVNELNTMKLAAKNVRKS